MSQMDLSPIAPRPDIARVRQDTNQEHHDDVPLDLTECVHRTAEEVRKVAKESGSSVITDALSKVLLASLFVGGVMTVFNPSAGLDFLVKVVVLAIAGALAMEGAKTGLIKTLKPIVALTSSEIKEDAKLTDAAFEEAKKSGVAHDKFRDPITLEIIKDPVAFAGDPTATVFERQTITELLKTTDRHPIDRSQKLDVKNLVSLPELKVQIKEFKKLHPDAS